MFLDALSRFANVTRAAEVAGLLSKIAYYYRQLDPVFARAWAAAYEQGVDRHEGKLQDDMDDLSNPMRTTAKIFY